MLLNAIGATAAERQPHVVFVIGTQHYSPHRTLPAFAAQLEKLGWRTTLVATAHDPEQDARGLPGLEALDSADVVVFYARFLTLPDDQLATLERYIQAGKAIVGLRTSTHAFAYSAGTPQAKWNDIFGREVLGSRYITRLDGTTVVTADHPTPGDPLLTGIDLATSWIDPGTLYLADLPRDAQVVLRGTGNSKRTGRVTNAFGSFELQSEMTTPVAWTWTNRWRGRVFTTTLGHEQSFADAKFVRLLVNGIAWAANKPMPATDAAIAPIQLAAAPAAAPKGSAPSQTPAATDPTQKFARYGIYAATAPRASQGDPTVTTLPLELQPGDRIALVGNTLFERLQENGHFETLVQQTFPTHKLSFRNLAWSADEVALRPRPENFADLEQHLTHERADVVLAAFGFNESFAGERGLPAFREQLTKFVRQLRSSKFNGKAGPRVVLVGPPANENITSINAADHNNDRLLMYSAAMREVAAAEQIGFVDMFNMTHEALRSPGTDLTTNGVHFTRVGYSLFSQALHEALFGVEPPRLNETLREAIVDKDRQFLRRYRPLNTFYYTGDRNKTYGYLDFLPAMRNFDLMVENRDRRIWDIAAGRPVPASID
ncbi:MAG: ThuA domain-containing protein, partial [Planctomycetaceae bacterium]|nr:ThuA domain-containing protein [Planctomycetaceae bacterium]